jgi:uroporphyrinogen decarboxylase
VRRHDVDAAIFFSDIVVPLKAIGVDLDIVAGVGPVVAHPIRELSDLDQLVPLTPDHVPYITESVHQLVAELGRTPLIGFAGAPFTLASYLVEGGPSKNHVRTKALMHGNPELWHALCARLAQISGAFLRVQAAAGASAIQLFDSWVGALNRADYVTFVQQHSAAALAAVDDLDVPKIHFGVGTGELLRDMGAAGADVVGVDYRVSLPDAVARLGEGYAVQGNLDPALLFAPWDVLERRVREIVDEGRHAPGHIFNLGHGVLPDVDPDVLTRVTALVHEVSVR